MSAGYTYAAIKEANRRANLINCGARFTNNRYRAGSFQLPGYTPVRVNFKADSAAALTISSFPKDFSSVGDGGTWKAAIDGGDAQTGTVNAAAGTSVGGQTAAAVTGSVTTATKDFSSVGDGGTVVVAIDGGSDDTATFNAAAGTSVSGATPSANISGEVDKKFNISVDGDAAEEVTLDPTGIPQVESTTVTAGAAAAGTMVVTVTASGMTGTPQAVNCAVAEGDAAAAVAGKVRTALGENANVAAYFTVGGTDINIVLTRKAAAANDATMAIALTNADSSGVTFGASVNTLAGSAALTTGALIATNMQFRIRALGGKKALVTVDYNSSVAGKYCIKSPTLGTSSSVVITRAATLDISDELKIGQAGGTETAGTGDCANLAAVTMAEILAVFASDIAGATASNVGNALRLTSDTTGISSAVAVKTGTLNTALGLTDNSNYAGLPKTDISAGGATKLKVQVNGDTAQEVTLTPTGLDTGAKIATALQTAIRALGGQKAAVTVAYSASDGGSYTITSSRLGTSSRVVVTNGTSANLADDLCLGVANGGTETAGTGDCSNLAAVTAAEFAAVLVADFTDCVITNPTATSVKITSETAGEGSKIVISDGTLNTALSTTEAAGVTGAIGLNYDEDMPDTNYEVSVTQKLDGSETIATDTYAVKPVDATCFDVYCSTSTSTNHVSVGIINTGALA